MSSTASSQLRTHACSGFCAPMRSNLSSSLSTAARTASGRSSAFGTRAVLRRRVVVALAQLLADGVHLAAQQHLALLLVDAFGHLVADAVLQLQVGQRLPGPRQRQLEARFDVDRLEQLDTLLQLEIGRVRGHVGQLTGRVDAREDVADAARAAVLEDRLDDGAVLLGQLPGACRSAPGRRPARPPRAARLRCRRSRCRLGPGRRRGSRARGCRWAARRRSRSGRSCRPSRSGRRPGARAPGGVRPAPRPRRRASPRRSRARS